MSDYKIASDQFAPWRPNLCVLIESGSPMPVTVASAKAANEAIKRVMKDAK